MLLSAFLLLAAAPASARERKPATAAAGVSGEAAWIAYDDLSQKWDALGPIHYAMTITTSYHPGPNTANPEQTAPTVVTFDVWEKGLYLRQEGKDESGTRYLTILQPDSRLVFDFEKNGYKRQKRAVAIHRSAFNINEGSRYLTLIGKDVLDGQEVTVFEDAVVSDKAEAPAPIKVWIRTDTGLAVKEEWTIPLPNSGGASLVAVTERKNVTRQAIPDSTFAVSPELVLENNPPKKG